jgi:hypothetical protein
MMFLDTDVWIDCQRAKDSAVTGTQALYLAAVAGLLTAPQRSQWARALQLRASRFAPGYGVST